MCVMHGPNIYMSNLSLESSTDVEALARLGACLDGG
jgi:hypothetical protein